MLWYIFIFFFEEGLFDLDHLFRYEVFFIIIIKGSNKKFVDKTLKFI